MRKTLIASAAMVSLTMVGTLLFATQPSAPQHGANMSMMQNCPMKVPGAVVSVADSDNGITLTITTKSDSVAELRSRIQNMVRMHSVPSSAAMHSDMMPFSIKYEEVANGARLILTPKDPAQLDTFRVKVRQHAEQMKKGECQMMQGMMGGTNPSTKPDTPPKSDDEDHSEHHPPGGK